MAEEDQGQVPLTCSYVIESTEYVRPTPLPPNALFDDLTELERMLALTEKSIKNRSQAHLET